MHQNILSCGIMLDFTEWGAFVLFLFPAHEKQKKLKWVKKKTWMKNGNDLGATRIFKL